jgi:hypothetical protein
MAEPIWLTTDEVLETAREFKGWKYRFQLKDKSGQTAAPQPTYPLAFLEKFGGGIFGSRLSTYQELARSDTKASNCVMFGEGLIVGTAARLGKTVEWDGKKHGLAMQAAGVGPKGVIQAYVDAGFAAEVFNGHEKEPFPWSIVQGDHHFWIVVDYDPGSGRVLTLEANVFVAPLSGGEVGFVGHNWVDGARIDGAWGVKLADEFLRTGTVNGFKSAGPKWVDTRAHNKELWFAKLYVREPTRVFSPLSRSDTTSAVFPGYSNNETKQTGHGGYYVFGLHRNLHGGIHLFPPRDGQPVTQSSTTPTKVSAMAAGYVVAARLPGAKSEAAHPDVLNLLRNWPGFVLLRHEIAVRKLLPGENEPEPTRHGLYSLYMHLQSPKYSLGDPVTIADNDPWLGGATGAHDPKAGAAPGQPAARPAAKKKEKDHDPPAEPEVPPPVPWFSYLYRARFGSWVRVRAQKGEGTQGSGVVGEMFWSAVAVPDPKVSAVNVYDGRKLMKLLVRDAKDRPLFVFKRAPATIDKALADLRDGKVVTFSEPLLEVRPREGLGYICGVGELPGVRRRGLELPDGFLHFQVFTAKDDAKAIDTLIAQAKKIVPGLSFAEVDCTEGNFLDIGVFKGKVEAPIQDDEDKKHLDEVFQDYVDHPDVHLLNPTRVVEMLDGKVSFAPKEIDGQAIETTWNLDGHCYPVRLDVEVPYLPKSADHTTAKNGGYRLSLGFRDAAGAAISRRVNGGPAQTSFELKIDDGKLASLKARPKPNEHVKYLSIVVQVPAEAESVEILDLVGDLDPVLGREDDKSEEMLFEATVGGHRWRDVKLTYANEWSVAEMDKAVDAIAGSIGKDQQYPLSKDAARQIAWCDEAKESPAARIFLKDGSEASKKALFDAALAPSKSLVCLHPMTAVWLLAMLGRNDTGGKDAEKVSVETSFDSKPHGGDRPPPLWGWVGGEGVDLADVAFGERLSVLVVDDDYSYDDTRRQLPIETSVGGKSPELTAEYDGTRSGLAKVEVIVDFWGSCNLAKARGGAGAVFEGGADTATVKLSPALDDWNAEEEKWGFSAPRRRARRYAFPIKFKPKAPRMLNGYAWVRWRKKGDASWTEGESYEYAQALSFADALQQTKEARIRKKKSKAKGLEVDKTLFTMDGDFILSPSDAKKTKNVTANGTWKSYVDAYSDIVLAASLADGIERLVEAVKADGITLALKQGSLATDGKSCVVVAQRQKPKEKAKKGAPPPPDTSAVCAEKTVPGLSLTAQGKNEVKVELQGGPQPAEACDKVAKEGLLLSEDHLFIHAHSQWEKKDPRVTPSFSLSRYRAAYDRTKIRLHENLAEGLELLRDEIGGNLPIEYLSLDGRTCHVSLAPKLADKAEEAAMQYFLGVSRLANGKLLRLTAAPESAAYGFVSVDATQLLQDVDLVAPDDAVIEYTFGYLPMALFYQTNKEQLIDRKRFDELKGETLTFPDPYLCDVPAGSFEQVGFPLEGKPEHFSLQPGQKACGLTLTIELRGDLEAWAHYQIVVTKNGKVDAQARLVGKSNILSIDCGPLGNMDVKLEAVLRSASDKPEDHPLPKPYTNKYAYTPKLDGFDADWDANKEFLLVKAQGTSLAPPVLAAPADREGWQYADKEDIAQALRLELEPNDGIQGGKLDRLVQYAFRAREPKDKKKKAEWKNHGFCDREGRFEARLPAEHVDPEKPLKVTLVAVPNDKKIPGLLPKTFTRQKTVGARNPP